MTPETTDNTVAETELGGGQDLETAETGMGLDENVAAALSYLFGVITGLIVYLIEQENEYVRFHAAQSIVVFGGLFVLSVGMSVLGTVLSIAIGGSTGGFIVFSLVSLFLSLLWFVMVVGAFGLWLYLMVRAYQGRTPRVPVAARFADRLV